nr:enolase C-terminal domain-like protein [Pseudonocardia sp. MH-G8]
MVALSHHVVVQLGDLVVVSAGPIQRFVLTHPPDSREQVGRRSVGHSNREGDAIDPSAQDGGRHLYHRPHQAVHDGRSAGTSSPAPHATPHNRWPAPSPGWQWLTAPDVRRGAGAARVHPPDRRRRAGLALSHAGGISEVRRIAALAETFDALLAPHCPLGPLALAASLQVAFVTPNFLIQEQSIGIHYNAGTAELLDYVLDRAPFAFRDGAISRWDAPGLGVEIDEDAVRAADRRGHRS